MIRVRSFFFRFRFVYWNVGPIKINRSSSAHDRLQALPQHAMKYFKRIAIWFDFMITHILVMTVERDESIMVKFVQFHEITTRQWASRNTQTQRLDSTPNAKIADFCNKGASFTRMNAISIFSKQMKFASNFFNFLFCSLFPLRLLTKKRTLWKEKVECLSGSDLRRNFQRNATKKTSVCWNGLIW